MSNTSSLTAGTSTSEVAPCYHCGEPCPDARIAKEDKHFCCQGCQTVYEILAENNLCNYYALEKNPGKPQKNRDFGDRFAFLDNPEIAQTLLNFQSDTMSKANLLLPNVHCSSCIWLLENIYRLHPGISYSRVNFMRRELSVSFDPRQISFREVAEMLSRLGYPPQINLQDLKAKKQQSENLHLLYKIGITGFCFGNIMLLSFPDYLAVEDWVDESYKYFFGYLNILLALPVFFYSSSDYFRSAYQSLRAGAINLDVPIALGILALFGRSLYEIISVTGAGYLDSLAGLLFFLLVGRWVQNRTYESLSFERDYASYFPLAVKVRQASSAEVEIRTVTSLKKNDLIQIRNQELVPADSILLSERAFIDYSFVSGEAEPLEKIQGDYIYAGGRQIGPSIELAVQKEVSQSYLTQLWNSEIFQEEAPQKIHRHVSLFSKYFTFGTLAIAFGALGFWAWQNPALMWNAFTAVLIVACPCALALSTPYALGNTMRIFGRNHFYLKNSDVVAHLAEIQHLVFDKTGTITHSQQADIQFVGLTLRPEEQVAIKSLTVHSTHPLSRKITAFLEEANVLPVDYFKEIDGQGLFGRVNGQRLRLGSRHFVEPAPAESSAPEVPMASRVYVSLDGQMLGYFEVQNAYRPGLAELLQDLQKHYPTSLITGDNAAEKARLEALFGPKAELCFQQKPIQKLEYIRTKQAEGQKMLMLGDGLNDAGALRQSDVGIALTEDTTSFSPACDAILDAKGFGRLAQFLHFSRTTMQVIRVSFGISLAYNLFGIAFAVSGTLSPVIAAILMPISSVTVVAFVVAATNLLAKGKGLQV
ncbi:MAG: HAD-IC family P-type ATPase [Microscillaceae bacterium]|nr:HAD-IC family P-type ATPase [Microscillaceae bacterium]